MRRLLQGLVRAMKVVCLRLLLYFTAPYIIVTVLTIVIEYWLCVLSHRGYLLRHANCCVRHCQWARRGRYVIALSSAPQDLCVDLGGLRL